jgi:hypothetical protein
MPAARPRAGVGPAGPRCRALLPPGSVDQAGAWSRGQGVLELSGAGRDLSIISSKTPSRLRPDSFRAHGEGYHPLAMVRTVGPGAAELATSSTPARRMSDACQIRVRSRRRSPTDDDAKVPLEVHVPLRLTNRDRRKPPPDRTVTPEVADSSPVAPV